MSVVKDWPKRASFHTYLGKSHIEGEKFGSEESGEGICHTGKDSENAVARGQPSIATRLRLSLLAKRLVRLGTDLAGPAKVEDLDAMKKAFEAADDPRMASLCSFSMPRGSEPKKDWSDWVQIWQDLSKGFHHLSYVPAIFSSSHRDVAATSTDFERAILDDEPTLILETAADVSLDIDLGDDGFVFDDDEDEADEDEEPEEPSAEVD
ncbi:hypothetical protein EDD18DRAFT_1336923 [Armillaria luteobubalina]|uniref:Uncharacterized protein n=1 Tax=Armillaria luteobubalina TaxID=153913 RepID=A0AA39PCJ4_9AGAR|nr:hypothetical protein EDD18DRAFT_1336923 [Armillaria luteobubalina]